MSVIGRLDGEGGFSNEKILENKRMSIGSHVDDGEQFKGFLHSTVGESRKQVILCCGQSLLPKFVMKFKQ